MAHLLQLYDLMVCRYFIVFISLFFTAQEAKAVHPAIMGAIDYEATKIYSQYLLHRFDSRTTIFIGVGASPTTILAFLQNYKELADKNVEALNLPLSASGELGDIKLVEGVIAPHFRQFIPKSLLSSRERIVLVDYAESGATLRNTFFYVVNFLRNEGIQIPVHIVAIPGDGAANLAELPVDKINYVRTMTAYLSRRLYRVRNLAEYPKFSLEAVLRGLSAFSRVQNPSYLELKGAIRAMMVADKNLRESFDLTLFDPSTTKGKYGSLKQTELWDFDRCVKQLRSLSE